MSGNVSNSYLIAVASHVEVSIKTLCSCIEKVIDNFACKNKGREEYALELGRLQNPFLNAAFYCCLYMEMLHSFMSAANFGNF